jgi:APA family basic amino acid/polyamine antiporter
MSSTDTGLRRHITARAATGLVIANVIGAGVFTTTGFQAADLGNPTLILVLWAVGGALAYCGALCYAELGAALPEAGAEYAYLRRSYGPAFGFMSAFVSLIAGFPAPIAAALKSLVRYLTAFFPILERNPLVLGVIHLGDLLAVLLIWALVAVQFRGRDGAIRFNNWVTASKAVGLVLIIAAAAVVGQGDLAHFEYVAPRYEAMETTALFAALGTSLIFVMFCYTGWNAAAYVASEIVEPQRNLPRSLLTGTAIVTVLYLGLNAVYLYGADVDGLAGKVEVGLVASRHLFGEWGAGLVTVVLGVSLLASASAMTIAGPRVYFALGRDVPAFGKLATTRNSVPSTSLFVQATVASIIVVTGTVDEILSYAGFTLALMSALAVSCVIVLRFRLPDLERPFRVWGYPIPPLFFIAVSVWTMFWAFQGRPVESTLAILTVVAGGIVFAFTGAAKQEEPPQGS